MLFYSESKIKLWLRNETFSWCQHRCNWTVWWMKRGKTYIAHDINILFIDCFNCLLLQRNHQSDPNAAVHNHIEIFVHFDADMAVHRVGHIRHSDAHPYHLWTVSGKHYINDILYLFISTHTLLLIITLIFQNCFWSHSVRIFQANETRRTGPAEAPEHGNGQLSNGWRRVD